MSEARDEAPNEVRPPRSGAPVERSFLLGLALVVAVAVGLRFGLLAAFPPERPVGDEFYYLDTAVEIAKGNGHSRGGVPHASWPPAQSYLLSLFIDEEPEPGERRSLPLLRAQCVLGTLLVLFIALLGRALFDVRTGLVAGAVAALYPTFIAFSHYIWSETLFLTLLTAALWCAVRRQRSGGIAWALGAGLLFGVAGLTREVAILIACGTAVWWVVTSGGGAGSTEAAASTEERSFAARRTWAHAALMLTIAAAVVLPWTWRNYRLFGRFVPVSTVSWAAIRQGNTFARDDWTRPPLGRARNFVQAYYADPDEMGRVDRAREEALELIRAEQPTWALKKLVRNSAMLFNPDSFLFKKISRGAYPDAGLGAVRVALVLVLASYIAVVTLGVLGIASARGQGRRMLALGVIGTVVGLHLLALGSPRYRLPVMPVLMVFGSYAATHARAWRPRRRAAWVAALVLAWFFLWCVPYFQADARSLWETGRYVVPDRP